MSHLKVSSHCHTIVVSKVCCFSILQDPRNRGRTSEAFTYPLHNGSFVCMAGAAVPRKRTNVRFVEDSPVLTPSWKSAAWNKKPQSRSAGQDVERSPDLRPVSDAVPADSEWEQAETQADREW